MEYFDDMICVTIDELTEKYDGQRVMSFANYNKLVTRNRIELAHRGGGLGGYVRVVYSSLPERFRVRFEAIHGNPKTILEQQEMEKKALKTDKAARDFYMTYILPNGKTLVDTKVYEYTINASVLGLVLTALNERLAKVKALGGGIPKDLWHKALTLSESYRKDYGHTLPDKLRGFRDKLNAYKRDGYAALISGKDGNENTLKITEEAGNQIIALKRSKVPVYTNAQIFDKYNEIALKKGWKPLKSVKSLVTYLKRPEVKRRWYDAVHGELAAHQKYTRKHKTELPSMRDALWYADGTKLNLYYKAYDEKGKLQVRTTQVYEVMDAFSETMLGYHISDNENYEAQYNSFRMAVQTAGHRPFEIVTDNQGGHKKLEATKFFERICHVFRFTAPYSGQSKTIESAFGRFQAEILHQDWRFTGQNITTKRENSRPNLEFIEANKENLYTLEELKIAYAKAREAWNNAKHPATGVSRFEMYQTSVNPETTEVDQLDMTQVRLYTKEINGMRYIATAEPYIKVHRAIQEQKPGEMDFIRKMDYRNKQERVSQQLEAVELEMLHGVAPEQFGLNRPKIKGLNLVTAEAMMETAVKQSKPAKQVEVIDVGLLGKQLSNITFNDVALLDKY